MRTFLAALAFAAVAGPAVAQLPPINMLNQDRPKSADEVARGQAIDDAYKSTMKKVPDNKASNDPWAGVRGSSQSTTKQGHPGSAAKSN
jgi:hypothetical protein